MINKSVITDIFILAHETSSSTHPPERHSIPWPISSNQWTPRIFSFVRSRDNSTISFYRSTLKVPWTLFLHLIRMLIYIYFIVDLNLCLFYISYVSKIIFFLYIFFFLFNSCVLSNVYNSYVLPFLWQKKKKRYHWPYLIHLNRESIGIDIIGKKKIKELLDK